MAKVWVIVFLFWIEILKPTTLAKASTTDWDSGQKHDNFENNNNSYHGICICDNDDHN